MTDSVERRELSLTVNGERRTVRVYPMERLLDTLRGQLGLTGTKEGCGEGECGSCSILMDGALVNSCLVPVLQAKEASIITIEGLAAGDAFTILPPSVPRFWFAIPPVQLAALANRGNSRRTLS